MQQCQAEYLTISGLVLAIAPTPLSILFMPSAVPLHSLGLTLPLAATTISSPVTVPEPLRPVLVVALAVASVVSIPR